MANINPTPPYRNKPKVDYGKIGPKGHTQPTIVIQSKEKDDLIWRKIVSYLSQQQRTVEEEYLLIERKESKLPSNQRLYIEIYINYNLQLEKFNNGKSN